MTCVFIVLMIIAWWLSLKLYNFIFFSETMIKPDSYKDVSYLILS